MTDTPPPDPAPPHEPATEAAAAAQPITGVASGSLGTAANLEDTQILRTDDLAAATPGWLAEDGTPERAASDALPPDEPALLQTRATPLPAGAPPERLAGEPHRERVVATAPRRRASATPKHRDSAAPRHRGPAAPPPASATTRSRRLPVAVGAAALLVLALIGGAGILSQLDFGTAQGVGGDGSAPVPTATAPAATPAQKPRAGNDGNGGNGGGHGNGGCHGNGNNSCNRD